MAADYRLNIDDDGTKVQAAFPGDDDIEFHELLANAQGIDDICTILHSESTDGNAERVRFIARVYADKNILVKLDSNKETALHVAAHCGHTDVVKVLIDAARRLPSSSANDDAKNQITTFEDFIKHPNDTMNTALHLAVSKGHMAIAKLLVEADLIDKHIQNSKGETPIYLAAKLGHEEIVQMICEACTAPNLAGPDGTTALHAAIMMLTEGKNEGLAVVKALIDAAKTSASSANRSYSSVKSFLRQSNKKDKDTALHLAVRRNHLDVVKHILHIDPSLLIINKQSDFKSTIYRAAEQGYTDMVNLLCYRYEAQNNLVHKGQTALCAVIIGRDKEAVIRILRSANHLVTNEDDIGWTPLHYAACYKFDSVLEVIVKSQSSTVNYQLKKKVPTPLCVAAKEGHVSTVIRLMELLPDSCIVPNYDGKNILHLAALQNNKKMIHAILIHCPQKYTEKILNGKDVHGNTPLHLLIRNGCFIPRLLTNNSWVADMLTDNYESLNFLKLSYLEEVVKYKWPVDMMTKNNKNWTPADMLYLEEEIIGDQLQIKIAIDYMQATQLMLSKKGPSIAGESLVPLSIRSRKDTKFENAEKEILKEETERSRQLANTQIVVTALITTIAFTVGFTMPGGLYQSGERDQGLAILSEKKAFKVFMVSDTLALLLSSYSLFFYFFESYEGKIFTSRMKTSAAKRLNMVSIVAMLITFVSGTYAVISHSPALANTVVIITAVFFIEIISNGIRFARDRKNEDMD